MSVDKQILFGTGAVWTGRIVTIVLNLVLIPVLFRSLPDEHLGFWLFMAQTWAGAAILDLGFGMTFTRRIALIKGKERLNADASPDPAVLAEMAELFATGKAFYKILAIVIFSITSIGGCFYIYSLEFSHLSPEVAAVSWVILCFSNAFLLWVSAWSCLIQAIGHVGWESIIATFASAVTLLAQLLVVVAGGGLVGLAVVGALGSLIQRSLVIQFMKRARPELFDLGGSARLSVFKAMISPSIHAWFTSIGIFMVFNTDQFFIAEWTGMADVSAYRAAFVLVHNVTVFAVSVGLVSSVFISHLWQAGDLEKIHELLIRNVRFGLITMLTAGAVLVFAGEEFFNLWLGQGNFVGYPILLLFLAVETLEVQSMAIATASRATEDEAFAYPSMLAGAIKIILALVLLPLFGLLGLAMAMFFSLLLTNHWYMVRRGLRRLEFPFSRYVKSVVTPCGVYALVMAGALELLRAGSETSGDLKLFFAVAAAAAFMFVIAGWMVVLTRAQKSHVIQYIKRCALAWR